MGKLLTIPTYSQPVVIEITSAQIAASKRKKIRAILSRLRAGNNLAKIRYAENLEWETLTEIVCSFIHWPSANAYIMGNLKAA